MDGKIVVPVGRGCTLFGSAFTTWRGRTTPSVRSSVSSTRVPSTFEAAQTCAAHGMPRSVIHTHTACDQALAACAGARFPSLSFAHPGDRAIAHPAWQPIPAGAFAAGRLQQLFQVALQLLCALLAALYVLQYGCLRMQSRTLLASEHPWSHQAVSAAQRSSSPCKLKPQPTADQRERE
jgi:hypothetical protein